MHKNGENIFAYIDDYVGIADACDATRHFNDIHMLIICLGLPINEQKLYPPSKILTLGLGVHINIPESSFIIYQEKLMSIHTECFHVGNKKYLSGKNFQSLLGKLIYLQKCVVPARTLELFVIIVIRKKITFLQTFSGSGMVQEIFVPFQWYHHF